jgi:hypothetical protein
MDEPTPADELAGFLSRFRVAGRPLTAEETQTAAARIHAEASLTAEQLHAAGYRHLTVVHGDLESTTDEAAVQQLRTWGDRHPGAVRRTTGTNDTTSWLLAPPHAEHHLAALEAVAHEHNPGWWQIRRAAR